MLPQTSGVLLLLTALGVTACSRAAPELGHANYRTPSSNTSCVPARHAANIADEERSSAGIKFAVRAPANYDATRQHPLIVVYAPATYNRFATERYTGLTPAATAAGYIIAYVDHRPLSKHILQAMGEIPALVAKQWCVDSKRVYYTGHSDGGSVAMGITFLRTASIAPAAIAPSGAGIRGSDLAQYACPPATPIMLTHSAKDERFPGFGREAVQWWARCNGCDVSAHETRDGCQVYACRSAAATIYCETNHRHAQWPQANAKLLQFFAQHAQASAAR